MSWRTREILRHENYGKLVRRYLNSVKVYVGPPNSLVGAKRSFWFAMLSIPLYLVPMGFPIISIVFTMLAVKLGTHSIGRIKRGDTNGGWIFSIIGILLGAAVFLFSVYTIFWALQPSCVYYAPGVARC